MSGYARRSRNFFRDLMNWNVPGNEDTIKPEFIPTADLITTVYDGIVANNTTNATTTILNYGVNVVTTVTLTNKAAKLPQPVTGKTVKVVNMSNDILLIFPSNVGGQINNYPINAPASIPPDGKLYEFICIENPLPGAWVWSAPATNQYDSGDVTANTTIATNIIVAANAANFGERNSFSASTGWGYNGKNNSPILLGTDAGGDIVAFKPSTPWTGITKIKVYTNLSATSSNVSFGLTNGNSITYYDPITDAVITNGPGYAGNFGSPAFGYCNNVVPGASLPAGTLTTNVGDQGTAWGELIYTGTGISIFSGVGDIFQGLIPNPFPPPVQNVNSWYSSYISFGIKPFQILTGFKFRFFIEYYQ